MPTHEAQAYKDPGTPEEQSRRKFLANATIGIGTAIGIGVGIPCLISLIPESLAHPEKSGGGEWAPLSADDFQKLSSSVDKPVKISISFKFADGYFPPANDDRSVWGVKLTPEQVANFKKSRPDLYTTSGKVDYDPLTMGFVIFSSICPHLGCAYDWNGDASRFICPCHGSQFDITGQHLAGPAPRGLDPLPFREANGKAEVTWIQYKSQQPDRLIVAYS